jgi:predicted membrane channel-forming protein YqfA (hemolysin III family)
LPEEIVKNTIYHLKENVMNLKLTPPKEITFWIAVALGRLGLFSVLGVFTLFPIEAFWLLFIGFVLLVVALLVKGM